MSKKKTHRPSRRPSGAKEARSAAKKGSEAGPPPLPEGFLAEMEIQFGAEEAQALAEGLQTSPSVSIRLNSAKRRLHAPQGAPLYPEMKPVPWAEGGYWLSERPSFTSNPLLHAGAFYVQEAASMYLSHIVEDILRRRKDEGLEGPMSVLDMCAAPGGKSVALLESLPEGSALLCNEVVPARASVLRENMVKWGAPGVAVVSAQASELGKMRNAFDLVVVDAPCSGEGMMRKEAVARSQWSPALVAQCAALQRQILEEILPALRPGGWLVYSTCTFNRTEDEENVDWACRELGLEAIGAPRRFTPHRDGTEGLFMALMRKEGEGQAASSPMPTAPSPLASRWLSIPMRVVPLQQKPGEPPVHYARTPRLEALLSKLPPKVRLLVPGLELGRDTASGFVPSHALALSQALAPGALPRVELEREEALRYLRREAIPMPDGTPQGFVLVCHQGYPLGLAKNLGTRANNLYPKEWRIMNL